MNWTGNSVVFKGYATGNGKKPTMSVKHSRLLSWVDVRDSHSFGGVLNQGYIDISFDSDELSQKFYTMVKENSWNCLILENPENGHIHSFWKIPDNWEGKDGKDRKLAVGLIADIHSGSTYIPLRVKGVDRFPPLRDPDDVDEVPIELFPINTSFNLLDLADGDGRNEELFRYILVLQSQLLLKKESIRHILENTNRFIFDEPLESHELDTVLRDESFALPVFFKDKSFLHNSFAQYLKSEYHIKRINGQLHVYDGGIYKSGCRFIESKMVELIPMLKSNQRTETLKYLEIITPEETKVENANLIAFRNGIYDLVTDELIPFDPSHIITNLIPWDWNPQAYDELCDKTLNKISCYDKEIRALLEECIGYCFFRQNELSKSFILTGSGSNGKSTYLDLVKLVLGNENYSVLDINELGDRFSTTMLAGRLANIGDDISDEFLQGNTIAMFKKIVSGNTIKAENKGQDAFSFDPTVKLLFSANEIPRMRNKGFDAIKRRLVIIPFNARFSKNDADYDGLIRLKLQTMSAGEYLIKLGIDGLKRILKTQGFTESTKVKDEIEKFEKDNNPLLLFLEEVGEDEILNHEIKEVFRRYDVFCCENGFTKMTRQKFTKEVNNKLGCDSTPRKISSGDCRKTVRVFHK